MSLLGWIFGGSTATAVRKASVRRAEALVELQNAEDRRDSRAIGLARMRLQEATRDALEAGA